MFRLQKSAYTIMGSSVENMKTSIEKIREVDEGILGNTIGRQSGKIGETHIPWRAGYRSQRTWI